MMASKLEREHLGLTFASLSLQIVGSQSDGVLGACKMNETQTGHGPSTEQFAVDCPLENDGGIGPKG